eukprot:gene27580-34028_t
MASGHREPRAKSQKWSKSLIVGDGSKDFMEEPEQAEQDAAVKIQAHARGQKARRQLKYITAELEKLNSYCIQMQLPRETQQQLLVKRKGTLQEQSDYVDGCNRSCEALASDGLRRASLPQTVKAFQQELESLKVQVNQLDKSSKNIATGRSKDFYEQRVATTRHISALKIQSMFRNNQAKRKVHEKYMRQQTKTLREKASADGAFDEAARVKKERENVVQDRIDKKAKIVDGLLKNVMQRKIAFAEMGQLWTDLQASDEQRAEYPDPDTLNLLENEVQLESMVDKYNQEVSRLHYAKKIFTNYKRERDELDALREERFRNEMLKSEQKGYVEGYNAGLLEQKHTIKSMLSTVAEPLDELLDEPLRPSRGEGMEALTGLQDMTEEMQGFAKSHNEAMSGVRNAIRNMMSKASARWIFAGQKCGEGRHLLAVLGWHDNPDEMDPFNAHEGMIGEEAKEDLSKAVLRLRQIIHSGVIKRNKLIQQCRLHWSLLGMGPQEQHAVRLSAAF